MSIKSRDDLLNKGNELNSKVDMLNQVINDKTVSEQEKNKAQEDLEKANIELTKLKAEIYTNALQAAGLDYKNGEINPAAAKEKYEETLQTLENEKQSLEAQRKKQEQIFNNKKDQIKEQFNIACEKYKEMLDAGKISQELYDTRIANMKEAKDKDVELLKGALNDIDKKIDDNTQQIDKVNTKIADLSEKEKKFNEYDRVCVQLFGENLVDYSNNRQKAIKDSLPEKDNEEKTDEKENEETGKQDEKEDKEGEGKGEKENSKGAGSGSGVASKEEEKEEEPKIVVTSKDSFNKLYKKLSNGTITDNELNALTEVLMHKENYDKYGITTGLIFNKARKILKSQGSRTFNKIEGFLQSSGKFSDDIKFDPSIEGEEVYSHEMLKSWSDVDDKLSNTDAKFSIDEYIGKIEAYKNTGNPLTKQQEKIYSEAMNIREIMTNYRNAVKVNSDVTKTRDENWREARFFGLFSKSLKSETKALPETRPGSGSDVIENSHPFDLSDMVNEPDESYVDGKDGETKNRDDDFVI